MSNITGAGGNDAMRQAMQARGNERSSQVRGSDEQKADQVKEGSGNIEQAKSQNDGDKAEIGGSEQAKAPAQSYSARGELKSGSSTEEPKTVPKDDKGAVKGGESEKVDQDIRAQLNELKDKLEDIAARKMVDEPAGDKEGSGKNIGDTLSRMGDELQQAADHSKQAAAARTTSEDQQSSKAAGDDNDAAMAARMKASDDEE